MSNKCCFNDKDIEHNHPSPEKLSKIQQNDLSSCSKDAKSLSTLGAQTAASQVEAKVTKKLDLLAFGPQCTAAKTVAEAKQKTYAFWGTQPVLAFDDEALVNNEAIEPDKEMSQIRQDPYPLPDEFIWADDFAIDNNKQLQELHTLLSENYIEDEDNLLRLHYSPDFLKWVLTPPGWHASCYCGVRVRKNGKLVAFMVGLPYIIRIHDQ